MRVTTYCLGIHFALLTCWALPRKVLSWKRVSITSREAKAAVQYTIPPQRTPLSFPILDKC